MQCEPFQGESEVKQRCVINSDVFNIVIATVTDIIKDDLSPLNESVYRTNARLFSLALFVPLSSWVEFQYADDNSFSESHLQKLLESFCNASTKLDSK